MKGREGDEVTENVSLIDHAQRCRENKGGSYWVEGEVLCSIDYFSFIS